LGKKKLDSKNRWFWVPWKKNQIQRTAGSEYLGKKIPDSKNRWFRVFKKTSMNHQVS
jgi:hypothetical protein